MVSCKLIAFEESKVGGSNVMSKMSVAALIGNITNTVGDDSFLFN